MAPEKLTLYFHGQPTQFDVVSSSEYLWDSNVSQRDPAKEARMAEAQETSLEFHQRMSKRIDSRHRRR